jgi:transposase
VSGAGPGLEAGVSHVGLDWGVASFVTMSNGEVIDQLQPLKKFLPRLAKLQRRLARKKKFSNNWKKAKQRVAKLHSKIANIRKDFVHKSSHDHRSDSGAIVRLRAVGIPSVHGGEDVKVPYWPKRRDQ